MYIPITLNNPPINHRYHGTCVEVKVCISPFSVKKRNASPKTTLLIDEATTAMIGCLSNPPNCELNPACMAKNTPPESARINKR